MDYEKKLRDYLNSSEVDQLYKSMILNLFPELKESEGEKIRKELIQFFSDKDESDYEGLPPRTKIIAWLEKQGEQKPWSEEDERMFKSALWHIKNSCGNGGKNSGEFEVYNWFKSLKERVGCEENCTTTWQPTKKQIIALRWVLKYVPYGKHKEEISGLLDQIKDL